MSGTFEQIDVPPTLVSFAVSTAKADHVVSTEFKNTDSKVILVKPTYLENGLPDFDSIRACFDQVEAIIRDKPCSCYLGSGLRRCCRRHCKDVLW